MTITENALRQKLDRETSAMVKQSKIDKRFYVEGITYESFLSNKLLMIFVIKMGVPYSFFDLIQHYAPLSENDWASLLDLSKKSLQRYRQTGKQFGPLQSEKIIEMAEITYIGLDVFGDMDKLKLWLDTPSFALGNLKPIDLLSDSYGKEMVISELTRINHGILV